MGQIAWKNEVVFVEDTDYPRHRIKERIIKQKLMPYECKECKNSGSWNNQKLVLQLEHINGIRRDNRIENLCFLCPNCHSQTKTYAARNKKNPKRSPKAYIDKNGVYRNIEV